MFVTDFVRHQLCSSCFVTCRNQVCPVPLNLNRLQFFIDSRRLDASKPITMHSLQQSGAVGKIRHGVKLLATVGYYYVYTVVFIHSPFLLHLSLSLYTSLTLTHSLTHSRSSCYSLITPLLPSHHCSGSFSHPSPLTYLSPPSHLSHLSST